MYTQTYQCAAIYVVDRIRFLCIEDTLIWKDCTTYDTVEMGFRFFNFFLYDQIVFNGPVNAPNSHD